MLKKQEILSSEESWKNVLALVPDENILFYERQTKPYSHLISCVFYFSDFAKAIFREIWFSRFS